MRQKMRVKIKIEEKRETSVRERERDRRGSTIVRLGSYENGRDRSTSEIFLVNAIKCENAQR